MKYSAFKTNDFIEDQQFQEWVYHSNLESDHFWKKWLIENPKKEGIVNDARDILLSFQYKRDLFSQDDKEDLLNRIKSNKVFQYSTLGRAVKTPEKPKTFILNKRNFIRYAVAASVLLFAVFYQFIDQHDDLINSNLSEVIIKSNPAGQKSQVQLPDGSIVHLNSESEIRYNENFEGGRKVMVKGEAFFDVKRNALYPFVVRVNHLEATVLGTSFNVSAIPGSKETNIGLITGKLLVEDTVSKAFITLLPNEGATSNQFGVIVKTSINAEELLYWTNGTIHFSKTPFDQTIDYLERWYGASIEVKNKPVDTITCSGKFIKENLENVLNGLSFSLDFEYTIEGKNIEIIFN